MSEQEKQFPETDTDARRPAGVVWGIDALVLICTLALVAGLLGEERQIDGVHLRLGSAGPRPKRRR
jgi:hypothetical protein